MSTGRALVDFLYALFIQGRFAEHERFLSTNIISQTHTVTCTWNLPSISSAQSLRGVLGLMGT